VVRDGVRAYAREFPRAADVLLLGEVGDSSAAFDRRDEAALYARYGIPEYWVVDPVADEVLAHRESGAVGYATVRRHGRGDAWTSPTLPSIAVTGADVLG
jgi:Uma2 family endonuclease